MPDERDDLAKTEELFTFLQGCVPEGYRIDPANVPQLTADQAWTVIWYLQNLYWRVPDRIERCDVCGSLYHTHREGTCLDFGEPPYHFCDVCVCTDEYEEKRRKEK